MSQEFEYFYEDEVFRFNKKGQLQLGMVLENAELVSSDEESDGDEDFRVTKGNIRVAWYPNGDELVLSERKVCLADRSLMPGDVVRRLIKGRDTQRGYCRQVRVMARVQLVTGGRQVLTSVDSGDLTPLEEFATDVAVCLYSWVGMIHNIKCRLLLLTKDGSSCYIADHLAEAMFDTMDDRDKECEFRRYDFYPGQCLQGTIKNFDSVEWVRCTDTMTNKLKNTELMKHSIKIRATVLKVEVEHLGVRWLCKAFSADEQQEAVPPKYLVMGDDLKNVRILNVFEPCTLQLGDRNYYHMKQGERLLSRHQWDRLRANFTKNSPAFAEFLNIPIINKNSTQQTANLLQNGFTLGLTSSDTTQPSGATQNGEQDGASNNVLTATKCSHVMESNSASNNVQSKSIPDVNRPVETQLTQVQNATQCNGYLDDTNEGKETCSSLTSAASEMAAALSSLTTTALAAATMKPPSKTSPLKPPSKPSTGTGCKSSKGGHSSSSKASKSSTKAKPSTDQPAAAAPHATADDDASTKAACDDLDYVDIDAKDEDDTASISSSGTSTSSFGASGQKKGKSRGPALMTRMLKKKKLRASKRLAADAAEAYGAPEAGERVVVETLMTTSYADVVWQDGSVEFNIPSSQLYPIHHLDDQEFFPGDFVVEQKPTTLAGTNSMPDADPHDYGVVQKVDHAGRTTLVKWFRTYTSGAEPQPILRTEQEVSVYDLRDHPDFRYRPGSVVIRVANFENDQTCATGQVLDNYPTGQVKVWWVDGSSSVCFPQDLYKVGEYDSDDGELWDDGDESVADEDDDDHSWMTASGDEGDNDDDDAVSTASSELSVPSGAPVLKTKLIANIEKARIAMSRLEEIFTQNPGLLSTQVLRQLLDCYKECRYMDRLMSTRFFHESNFAGLIEKVRARGRASSNQKMTEQFNRLFSVLSGNKTSEDGDQLQLNSSLSNDTLNESRLSTDDTTAVIQTESTNNDVEISNMQCKPQETATMPDDQEHPSQRENTDVSDFPNQSTIAPIEKAEDLTFEKGTELNTRDSKLNLTNEPPQQPPCKQSTKTNCKSSNTGGTGLYKRLSDSDILSNHHNTLDSKTKKSASHIKDSKSCNDIKNSTSTKSVKASDLDPTNEGSPNTNTVVSSTKCSSNNKSSNAETDTSTEAAALESSDDDPGCTASMCIVLCSMMKVQLLKSYDEVVTRYGGHCDMSSMQAAAQNADESSDSRSGKLQDLGATDTTNSKEQLEEAAISQLSNKILSDVMEATSQTPPAVPDTSPPQSPTADTRPSDRTETPAVIPKNAAQSSTVDASSECGSFMVLEFAPDSHKFKLTLLQPNHPSHFYKTVKNEMRLLQSSLPAGIWVRGYQDRMDLYSVMIQGPSKTPYQDGLFLFDFQLSADYPHAPPLCNYITYCSDRLNPNLYEDGKVCVSLLGTWSGKGTEMWTHRSNLLQVIISIQGLILVSEPYFNEAGYERQKGSQQGHENSRMYNEMVLLKLIQSTARMLQHPPSVFKEDILEHFNTNGHSMMTRLERWLQVSEGHNKAHPLSPTTPNTYRSIVTDSEQQASLPEFPLIPASKGFCLTLRSTLPHLKAVLDQMLDETWNMDQDDVSGRLQTRASNAGAERTTGDGSGARDVKCDVDVSRESIESGLGSASCSANASNSNTSAMSSRSNPSDGDSLLNTSSSKSNVSNEDLKVAPKISNQKTS